ncbi:MAG TPA: cytochrome c3 family protein, partial [Pseudobdellovibrionaceae bacterium]|nr:cytochrome c3 family protein [Pseudobdellovibrionaceae bacterium]
MISKGLLCKWGGLIMLICCLLSSAIVSAETEGILNKLLAPGPLIEGHKSLEGKDCLKCHDAGKGISETKCLSCHKEIKPFVESQKGFHGIAAQNKTCIQCHKDHKGRAFDSTVVDEKSFDHLKMTGYSLEGK